MRAMAGTSQDVCYKATEEEELAAVEYELHEIEVKLLSLTDRKEYLIKQKERLKDAALLKKSLTLAERDWNRSGFTWSKKLDEVLHTVFKLPDYRPHQLQTINAVLSKEDVILLMPTGGGKSLCYQLPALVSTGVTLVVSPLIALMEDQLIGLKKLNVNAAMLSASCSKGEVNSIMEAMVDKNSKLKLLYVTPERLAKSKRFMTKLQKMYGLKRLSLLAIDEVHCCSHWGHDFRPDYKFLGVLKAMFPDVPILGLTATATSKVIVDVQKMLNIQGCLVFKASFNRPNLYYEVRQKTSVQKECYEELAELLKVRFAGCSGIIYSTSIKDCEELMQELRSRNLAVGCYHANLDAKLRSKVHEKWLNGTYQAVVATIAFGLGIDKPDVRFVIHHSLSKSMENFYQESGRAGRDSEPAECILFYRFADVFRLSPMVFTQQTGLENLYGIVAYCLDKHRCRRSIIASHFDEGWKSRDCNAMCDHCRQPREKKDVEISQYCRSLYKIISHSASSDSNLTGQMLIDAWFGRGKANLRVKDIPVPTFGKETAECIVAHLLIEGYLKEDFHFTPYSTISYIKRGPRASVALSEKSNITITTAGKLSTIPSATFKVNNSAPRKTIPVGKKADDLDLNTSLNNSITHSKTSSVSLKQNESNSFSTSSGKETKGSNKNKCDGASREKSNVSTSSLTEINSSKNSSSSKKKSEETSYIKSASTKPGHNVTTINLCEDSDSNGDFIDSDKILKTPFKFKRKFSQIICSSDSDDSSSAMKMKARDSKITIE